MKKKNQDKPVARLKVLNRRPLHTLINLQLSENKKKIIASRVTMQMSNKSTASLHGPGWIRGSLCDMGTVLLGHCGKCVCEKRPKAFIYVFQRVLAGLV